MANGQKDSAKKAGLAVAVPKEAVILYASNVHIHVSKFGKSLFTNSFFLALCVKLRI